MAEKNRTNWSDKARRITGGITLIVIILIILLCVLLGKKTNKSAEPEATVQPVPVVTEVKEQEKKEEPVTVAKDSPVVEEKVDTKIEEPEVPVVEEPIIDIEVTDEPLYSSGEVSFEVCGITVQNSWSDGIFVSTSNAKERFLKDDVMAFVRYEADKYLSYMDKETVFKIIVSTGTIKIEYPSSIDPEILMPYYKNDIEEYASSIAPKEETIEEPIVKEVVEEKVAEVVPETADFTVFGYKVLNSWIPGTFTSVSETKGLLYESDVKGFAEYEIGKYGDFLLENVTIEYVADGFVLTYPETVDPAAYISQYKSDIEEYVSTLFAPVEVEEPVKEEVKVEEPVVPETADFTVFGYKVLNSWIPGTFTSVSETKGLLSESDVKGFAEYEIGKYGDFLLENVAIEYVADGFVLRYPEAVDPASYISQYKSDIEEYVLSLFAPVEEVEEPVTEVVPSVISGYEEFKIMGFVVENTWCDGTYLAETAINGILTDADIRGFVLYEVAKYGAFLTENVAVEYTPDGFMLSIPRELDPSPYIPVFKSDIEEYISKLFAPVEEEVKVEERVVEVVPDTADFTVFGYKVLNSWVPGTFTSLSETKGLLSESDVKGFVEYEIGKYGDFLLENVAIKYVADGFVLTYPEAVNPSAYISQYKSDIEEYVLSLFAPVEEVEEPVTEVVPSVISGYEEFKIMGFVVENTWCDGTYLAETAINGILTDADIRGFVLYEVAKYGAFLTENVAVEYTPDGFMLSIPRELDPSPYIPVFKSNIEEYISKLFAPVEEVVEEPVVEETVEAPVVPEPVSNIVVSVVTDGVKVVLTGDDTSPVAEKVTSFDVSLSLGADFGFKTGRSYNPTIFPTFNITGEFRNMFSLGPIGVGTRFDAAFIFRPLDGTFVGHEFKFFLNGNNWAVDGTLDTKLMFSLDWGQTRAYLGIGVGYSLASNVSGITSHIGPQVFGFNSAVVTTGVLGLQWKLGDALFMSLEGQGRYFVQTKEYNFGGAVRIGWSF